MSTGLPRFDRMVDEFAASAERSGRRVRRGALVPAVAVALMATGAALAASGTLKTGGPIQVPRPPFGPLPDGDRLAPAEPGTVRLAQARAPDPDGGPPWGVRTFRTTRGTLCAQAGRIVDGRLGLIGFDGAFHELPPRTNLAACEPQPPGFPGAPPPPGAVVASEALIQPATTVRLDVNGVAGRLGCDLTVRPLARADRVLRVCDVNRFRYVAWGVVRSDVRGLEVTRVPGPSERRELSLQADRSFVYVLRGADPRGARVKAMRAGGRLDTVARAGRGWAVPTGHPDAGDMRAAGPRVTPAEGDPTTVFTLRWRAPREAEASGGGWNYRIDGPGGSRCNVRLAANLGEPAGGLVRKRRAREGNEPLPPSRLLPQSGVRRGERVVRRLGPPGPGRTPWCPGRYTGEIRFGDKIVSGRFSFRVR